MEFTTVPSKTHWVYTEAGIAESLEKGVSPDRRQVGQPIEREDVTRCPKFWIEKGYVREATPEEHAAYLSRKVKQ